MSLWSRRKKNNNLQKIVSKSEIPLGATMDFSHFEINSNREIIIEGCKGILQYDENLIRVNMGKLITSFCGRGLTVKCLGPDSLIIVGFITSIEFVT